MIGTRDEKETDGKLVGVDMAPVVGERGRGVGIILAIDHERGQIGPKMVEKAGGWRRFGGGRGGRIGGFRDAVFRGGLFRDRFVGHLDSKVGFRGKSRKK